MMIQWARLAAWQVKRSTKTTGQIEKNFLTSKYEAQKSKNSAKNTLANINVAVKHGSYGRVKILTRKATFQDLPLLPMSNLRTIVESAYHPGEGRQLTDSQHYVSSFVQHIGLQRNLLKMLAQPDSASAGGSGMGGAIMRLASTSRFTQEMEKLMHECVLWDTNNLEEGYRKTLKFIHTGSLAVSPGSVTEMDGEERPTALPEGAMIVLLGHNPELTHSLVKAAFQPYHNPIKVFLEEVTTIFIIIFTFIEARRSALIVNIFHTPFCSLVYFPLGGDRKP